jgi:hypothetical protein
MGEQDVTLGEVYRLLQLTNANVDQLRSEVEKESHSLRNKLGEMQTRTSVMDERLKAFREDIDEVKADRKAWKGWVSGIVGGGIVSYIASMFRAH